MDDVGLGGMNGWGGSCAMEVGLEARGGSGCWGFVRRASFLMAMMGGAWPWSSMVVECIACGVCHCNHCDVCEAWQVLGLPIEEGGHIMKGIEQVHMKAHNRPVTFCEPWRG